VNAIASTSCIVSTYSGQSSIFATPTATITDSQLNVCANQPVVVTVMLSGAAPFTITWTDGPVQSNINSTSVTRTMTFNNGLTIVRVASVTDAHCPSGGPSNELRVTASSGPSFTQQPQSPTIQIGTTANLSVTVVAATSIAWYEGEVGDTSKHVGVGATFTTPHLHEDTKYWVRAIGTCGSTDSQQATVHTIIPRRRPSGH